MGGQLESQIEDALMVECGAHLRGQLEVARHLAPLVAAHFAQSHPLLLAYYQRQAAHAIRQPADTGAAHHRRRRQPGSARQHGGTTLQDQQRGRRRSSAERHGQRAAPPFHQGDAQDRHQQAPPQRALQ